jgi:fermentation-respiration switch protein FrsA (DUF1100 family)
MARKDIAFSADGVTLRGWLYMPDGKARPPVVVMSHGFSAVKEQYLDRFAEVFAAAGLAALVYDHRNLGASDGAPRQEFDPWVQVRDMRHAVSFAQSLGELDGNRVGIWGTSYSGGHALVVGAIDARVRCVVAQVPAISGQGARQRFIRPDFQALIQSQLDGDRAARFAGGAPAMLPVVAADPMAPCALPGADGHAFFTESQAARAPAWRNEVTLRTLEMAFEYEPGAYISRIAPKPLLMIVAGFDALTGTDLTLEAYNRAGEPKRLVLLPGGHFDPYLTHFDRASAAARDFLVEHLHP